MSRAGDTSDQGDLYITLYAVLLVLCISSSRASQNDHLKYLDGWCIIQRREYPYLHIMSSFLVTYCGSYHIPPTPPLSLAFKVRHSKRTHADNYILLANPSASLNPHHIYLIIMVHYSSLSRNLGNHTVISSHCPPALFWSHYMWQASYVWLSLFQHVLYSYFILCS